MVTAIHAVAAPPAPPALRPAAPLRGPVRPRSTFRFRTPRPWLAASALALGVVLALAGCSAIPGGRGSTSARPEWDPTFTPLPADREADPRIVDRRVVSAPNGDRLIRVRFSYAAYSGWIGVEDDHRATGTVWFPSGRDGRPKVRRDDACLVSEYPPGTSASGFAYHAAWGKRPAAELRIPTAVVDVRGPIAREVRQFANPAGDGDETFRSEEQFALSMLAAWREEGSWDLLHETHVARAWLRALRAVHLVVRREIGGDGPTFLVAAEGLGAVGALRAATIEPAIVGLALTAIPPDQFDFEKVRARRWEGEADFDPLASLRPIPWDSTYELERFFASTWRRPDSGCPSCPGIGAEWREHFDYATLRARTHLEGVQTLWLVGDSDPRFPIDLESRAIARYFGPPVRASSTPPDALTLYGEASHVEFLGRRESGYTGTPASDSHGLRPSLFDDLRYLPGRSTLATREAAEAALGWAQRLDRHRDVPRIVVHEAIVNGNHRLDVVVSEGNTSLIDVSVRILEVRQSAAPDFKAAAHEPVPAEVPWQKLTTRYLGPDSSGRGRWTAEAPVRTNRARAWLVDVETRVGSVRATHSMPIVATFLSPDPAGPPYSRE